MTAAVVLIMFIVSVIDDFGSGKLRRKMQHCCDQPRAHIKGLNSN